MSALAALNGLFVVAEAAAASVILPPLGWLLARTYSRRAASRRLVWATVFAALLALPFLCLIAPSAAVIALPAAPVPAPAPVPTPAAALAADASAGFGWSLLIPLIAAVWLAGLVKFGGQHLLTLVRLELMRRAAEPWPNAPPVAVRGCQLLMSEDCPGPITWGVLWPVILLPDEALDWPKAKLEAVLRHELAHVQRRDGLVLAMAAAACALYWINPLVWWAARSLRREAELAADDAVLAAGVRPSDYAGQLVELAAQWRERRLTPTGLVAMAAPPALSQRVQSILSTDAIRSGATPMDIVKLALVGSATSAALLAARPSLAEAPAPAAPPSPVAQPAPPTIATAPLPPPPTAAPALAAAPAAPSAKPAARTRISIRLRDDGVGAVQGDGKKETSLTAEQREELHRQLAEIAPQIEKALKDAHIQETVIKALKDAHIDETVAKALKDADAAKIVAHSRVDLSVDQPSETTAAKP